jgi:hypothetical protein
VHSEVVVVKKRFWVPHGHEYLLDDNGFLCDPERTFSGRRFINTDALTEDDLRAHRFLVLLGEPGMGKSIFLQRASPLLPEGCDAVVVDVDLGEFGSEDRLARAVFESAEIERWLAGSGELCLIMDGFDDAQTRIPQLGLMVARILRRWPMDRLWLRIACRTSDWPDSLAGELPRLASEVKVVEFLPLRRGDVAELASGTEVSPEPFLAEVEERAVGALAARPLTLTFLLDTFATACCLPEKTGDLYRRGLLAMCDEQNPARRAALPHRPSSGDLYAVARRAAAATAFGGAAAVWTGSLPCPAGEDVIAIDDLAGGTEPGAGEEVVATLALVREMIRTPLFSGRGDARMGWAHTTFQDFLAADWLSANALPDHQVRSLLLGDDSGARPQVRRVAAWTVALAPDRFGWLTDADPESFVGQVDIPDLTLRKVLVERLLAAAAVDQVLGGFSIRYTGLAHPELAEQLIPVLAESGPSRWLALRLASDCDVAECDPTLRSIALDPNAPMNERIAAGWALYHGHRSSNALLALVEDETLRDGDVHNELLGLGLLTSWRHTLSTAQALNTLTQPTRRYSGGAYDLFISELANALTIDDVAAAAAWLSKTDEADDARPLARVRDACLKLCAHHLDNPVAAAAAVATATARLLSHDRILTEDESLPVDVRRRLSLMIVREHPAKASLAAAMIHGSGALLSAEDFLWLLDRAGSADPAERAAIHALLPWLVDSTRFDHADAVLSLDEGSPMRPVFGNWLGVVDLADPAVAETRRRHQRLLEQRRRRDHPHDDIEDRIVTQLDRFERGDPAGYWNAARLVCVRPGSGVYQDEHQPDLTAHPRWDNLPATVRGLFVALGPRYLVEGRCEPDRWLGKDLAFHPAEAAYRALLLLLRQDPAALDALPAEVWQEWAPIIVAWPSSINGGAYEQDKKHIVRHAIPHAREQLRTALLVVIDHAIRTGDLYLTRIETNLLWDDRLQQELTGRLEAQLPDAIRAELASTLLRNAPQAAEPLLISWLNQGPERSIPAADLLLRHRAHQTWPAIHGWLTANPEDGEKVLLSLAHGHGPDLDLPVNALVDLCLWLWDHFPPTHDPEENESGWISPRMSMSRWRDRIPDRLSQIGTAEAVAAIRRIAEAHPESGWLKRVHAAARVTLRQATWTPIPPQQLRQLANDSHQRLVRTEKELLDAVITALSTIQQRLVGETPESHLLWDTTAGRPKTEDEISDYLHNRLTDELPRRHIVINREVQVRRNRPTGIGERTDLRIDASTPNDETITAVIEVKTAWNDEVTTALPDQLVTRYMNDIGTHAGIYIVLWTNLESWTEQSSTRDKAISINRIVLTEHLTQQATEQAAGGRDIRVVHLDIPYLRNRTSSSTD